MISQERHLQDSTQADYSSVRSNVEKQNRKFEVADDCLSISSKKDYASIGNQNISSVLSQIQDDGPAQTEAGKTDNLYKLGAKNNNPYAEHQQHQSGSDNNFHADPAAELQQINLGLKHNNSDDSGNIPWKYTFLFILVISAVVFYLVRIDIRTNQLEDAINSHQKNIQNTMSSYGTELSPDLNSINQSIIDVKNTLEKITSEDSDFIETEMIGAAESVLELDKFNLMEDEIALLKNELEITKNKLVIAGGGLTKQEDEITALVVKKINSGAWAVNLASFEDRARAETAVNKLLPSGFYPYIEVAFVNGVKKYRLIVSGFSQHDEAEVFVGLAADLYGFSGGWIRRVAVN